MIWVIAGTKDSRELIDDLLNKGFSVIATTVSEFGSSLFKENNDLEVVCKAMTMKEMLTFIDNHNIKLIADASHPYAAEVSENAIAAGSKKNIPYIRFERESITFKNVQEFNNYSNMAAYLEQKNGNVLLSIGSRNLNYFSELKDRLFARILPVKDSIESCEKAGIKPDRIICMLFPFSKEFHKSLYRELSIKFLVTKESGKEGWTNEKVNAAFECGVEVLMIKRPEINYPEVYYSHKEIIQRAGEIIK